MLQRILAKLLHWSNANPPHNRTEFYALKTRLLHKYAKFCGHDLQVITKQCYGDGWWHYDGGEPCGPNCCRCNGTGIFDQRWIRLERWQWGRFLFHVPSGDTRIKPDSAPNSWIHGVIEHPDYGRISNEACLWLYLLCGEWRMFWKALRSSCCCGWYWWPMLNVQRVTMNVCMKLRRQKCWCGKMFFTFGSGHQFCKACRNKPQDLIPF